MQYTIDQLHKCIFQKVYDTYEIFKNFFGEDNVDLQGNAVASILRSSIAFYLEGHSAQLVKGTKDTYEVSDAFLKVMAEHYMTLKSTIYVWWSNVTVTNENDRSVNIQDLYAKIEVQADGRIPYENKGFLLNRATYTKEQFLSNYCHSHIQYIPKDNFTKFMPPCLGRGPINETIGTLKNDYDEITWMLFCQELSMYVTVESLAGVPWKHLEEIGKSEQLFGYSGYNFGTRRTPDRFYLLRFTKAQLKDFIFYYLRHGHLSFSFRDNTFKSGISYYEYIIDISNTFINYYNEYLKTDKKQLDKCFSQGLLVSAKIREGKFYSSTSGNYGRGNIDNYRGKHVLTFKGRDIRTTITDSPSSTDSLTILLDHSFAMYILDGILRTINYRFRNGYNKESRTEEPATVSERVCYI